MIRIMRLRGGGDGRGIDLHRGLGGGNGGRTLFGDGCSKRREEVERLFTRES